MAAQAINRSNERNKLIAAIVLGLLALVALYFAFGRGLFGSSAAAKATPTPKPSVTPSSRRNDLTVPTAEEQNFTDVTTPIVYNPGSSSAPDPGRNIFAFYEPAPPCPPEICPTPTPKPPEVKTPTPTPVPAYTMSFVNPGSIYAGSNGFRLEVNGDKFDADARIYFNQTEFPTTFVSPQKLFADIPSNLIAQEGSRQVIVQSPDGRKYSVQYIFSVQAPPRPAFTYIGMIARKRSNNDTGYFMESGKPLPFGARLNDVIGGRFRLIKLTAGEAVFEDTSLGFKHRIPIAQATASGSPAGVPGRGVNPSDPGFSPMNPTTINPADCPPGIPCNNIPRFVPPAQVRTPDPNKKEDVDDNDDGDN